MFHNIESTNNRLRPSTPAISSINKRSASISISASNSVPQSYKLNAHSAAIINKLLTANQHNTNTDNSDESSTILSNSINTGLHVKWADLVSSHSTTGSTDSTVGTLVDYNNPFHQPHSSSSSSSHTSIKPLKSILKHSIPIPNNSISIDSITTNKPSSAGVVPFSSLFQRKVSATAVKIKAQTPIKLQPAKRRNLQLKSANTTINNNNNISVPIIIPSTVTISTIGPLAINNTINNNSNNSNTNINTNTNKLFKPSKIPYNPALFNHSITTAQTHSQPQYQSQHQHQSQYQSNYNHNSNHNHSSKENHRPMNTTTSIQTTIQPFKPVITTTTTTTNNNNIIRVPVLGNNNNSNTTNNNSLFARRIKV